MRAQLHAGINADTFIVMDAWHTYADRHAHANVHSRTLSHEVAKYEH